jgi:hypothetical protein
MQERSERIGFRHLGLIELRAIHSRIEQQMADPAFPIAVPQVVVVAIGIADGQ